MDHATYSPVEDTSAEDGAHKRNQNRDSLLLVAQFRLSARRSVIGQVRVRNLSSGGLMADVPVYVPPGTAVEFDVRGIGWIPGQVAWFVAGRIGVSFDHPIDPQLARKPVKAAGKPHVFVKPILPVM